MGRGTVLDDPATSRFVGVRVDRQHFEVFHELGGTRWLRAVLEKERKRIERERLKIEAKP
jgi:hypothetical protein